MSKEKSDSLKDCLADAFFELLKGKNFTKITVDEIAEKAGVGRMTYFRNFYNKLEVMMYKLNSLSEEFYASLSEQPKNEEDAAYAVLRFTYSIKDKISILCKQSPLLLWAYYSSKIITPKNNPKEDLFKTTFFYYGFFGIVTTWNDQGWEKNPEEVLEYFKQWVLLK